MSLPSFALLLMVMVMMWSIIIAVIEAALPDTNHYPTSYTQFEADQNTGVAETELDYTQKTAYLGNRVSVLDFPPGYFGFGGGFASDRKFKMVNPALLPGNVLNYNPYTPQNKQTAGVFEPPEPPGWSVPKEAPNEQEDPFNGMRARELFPTDHIKQQQQQVCQGCVYKDEIMMAPASGIVAATS